MRNKVDLTNVDEATRNFVYDVIDLIDSTTQVKPKSAGAAEQVLKAIRERNHADLSGVEAGSVNLTDEQWDALEAQARLQLASHLAED